MNRVCNTIESRMLGCLYGQAIGDALGFATEAMSKNEVVNNYPNGVAQYSDIIQDDRRRGWPIGGWTDDTEMTLLILESIIENGDIEIKSIARKFLDWYDVMGYKVCGILTKKALNFAPELYEKDPITVSKLVWELKGRNNAPNGGLMRTSIVGLWPKNIETNAKLICQMTHYDSRCVASCVIASEIIYSLVWQRKEMTKGEIVTLGQRYDPECSQWIELAFNAENLSSLELDNEESMAYTYRTLAAALWCHWHAKSFEEGLLGVVNEGGDADTNAAIACAILGAKFGYDSIPKHYIENLHNQESYRQKADKFITLALNEN